LAQGVLPPRTPPRRPTEARAVEVSGIHEYALPGELLKALRVLLVTAADKLPMLPEIATGLMALANRPNVDLGPLAREIERDVTVAGRLLAIANSAFYRRAAPVTSVKGAVLRLGLRETRDVIFRITSSATVFRVPEYVDVARTIQRHSVVAAYLCREICRVMGVDQDLAYLCGLFHDVGKVILLLTALRAKQGVPRPTYEQIADVVRDDHAEAGALTTEYWKLPAPLVSAVRNHHFPPPTEPYALATGVANRICHHLGVGGPPEPLSASDAPLLLAARIRTDQLKALLQFGERVVQEGLEAE
jgi:putative nucleotidyltransferase with HDIG domain